MEFDSMESVENILSSALGKGILTAVVYAFIVGVIIFILVKLAKQGIEALKAKFIDMTQKLRDEEESKQKLLEWATKQDLMTQKQKENFLKIAQEKAAFQLSLTNSSHSDQVVTWQDRIVKTKESYGVFRNKKALHALPESTQKNVAEFLMDSFLDTKGQPLKMQIGKDHGTFKKLDRKQFEYMVGGLLNQRDTERLNQTGVVSTHKKILGNEMQVLVSLEDQTIEVEWIPKEIEKVEKVKEVAYVSREKIRGNDEINLQLNDSDFDIDIGFSDEAPLEEVLDLDFDLSDINFDDIGLDNMETPVDFDIEQEMLRKL